MTPAIEVEDAFRIYEGDSTSTVALQGLDLAVAQGEIVVVLGPSGSGKTTLLRVLAGLEPLSAGRARVLGTELGALERRGLAAFRATHVGLLDQHYARSLSPDLTCRHSVALQLELGGVPRAASRAAADELLDRVDLLDRADDSPTRLSGGEQQRVAVCAAVVHRPELLLADEPAGELDALNARRVYELLAALVRGASATALIVSHDPVAASIADRLVSIRDGRIVEHARPGGVPLLVISRKGWAKVRPARAEAGYVEASSDEHGRIVLQPRALDPGPAAAAPAPGPASAARGAPGEVRAELVEVSRSYPVPGGTRPVLEGLSHRFRDGCLSGLVGRSGSGKTTLLHLLAGLDRPSAGSVSVAGRALGALGRAELADLRRREVALVTQEPGLIPYLTALENVELGLAVRGAVPAGEGARALALVGLVERSGHRASDLSAGERERVAIARALATRARLLLVDEPTARLDQENARAIARLLAESAHRDRIAVICATHDPELIEVMDETIELAPA